MQKQILILITAIALGTSAAIAQHHHEQEKQRYTCPMHPEVVMDHPGKCPKCGMTLVPVKEKKRSTLNPPSQGYGAAGAQRLSEPEANA